VSRHVSVLSIVLVFALAVASAAQSATTSPSQEVSVPRLMKFSGTVRDEAGHARSGVIGITFALYKDQQGGAPLWLETQNVQADGKGNYTVLLGSSHAEGLPTDIFASSDARWLGVQVEGQQEQPRTLLVSAPYALKALDAETIGGKPASSFQLATPEKAAAADQSNEIRCSSGTACKTNSIPVFTTNGGSATVTDSIVGQSASSINVAGAVNAQGTNGSITASQNISASGNVRATGNVLGNERSATNQVSGTSGNFPGTLVAGGGITGANLSTSGTVSGTTVSVSQNISAIGTVFGGAGNFSGNVTAATMSAGPTAAGIAVFGDSSVSDGIFGNSSVDADFNAGILGQELGSTKETLGVFGRTSSASGAGVYGQSVNGSATGAQFFPHAGVWADTGNQGSNALLATADDGLSLQAINNSPGRATVFVLNQVTPPGTATVLQTSGLGGFGCAIDVAGNLTCAGDLSGSSKSFKIDHPLDPANKYLVHDSVESSEMMNIYTGNIITDTQGDAMVSLPDWFEALNTDFRYQLTVVGQFAQAIVAREIENHQFEIKTSASSPGVYSLPSQGVPHM